MSPLWTQARDFIRTLFSCCGEPQDIAERGFIARKLYMHLLAWIRAGETLLRRMLLIEAHALGPRASSPQRRKSEPRQRKLVEFFPDKPDDWRVSFRCISSSPARGGSAEQREAKGEWAPPVHATWPLALRAEALLRICNNPAPYIARLARLIARVPKLIARIIKPPHEPKRQSGDPPSMRDIVGRTLWDNAAEALPNTS